MKNTLKEIVCESLQEDECIRHCNYPHCYKVNTVVDNLIKHNVILTPVGIGATVYYISGIHNRLVKPAKVEDITFNGSAITLGLVSENNVYFDMLLDKVYINKTDAEAVKL